MKEIREPSLDKNNQVLKNFLRERGIKNIAWFLQDKCLGDAMSDIDDDNNSGKIIFRDENLANNQFVILHELLHLFLHVKGYPKVVASDYGDTVQQLDNVFSHAIMGPYLNKFGYSFLKLQMGEWSGIERSIGKLKKSIIDYSGDNLDKLLLNIVYIRAKSMRLPAEKLEDWRSFLISYSLYDENIIRIIENNLPKLGRNYEMADIAIKLEKCLEELGLRNAVNFKPFLPHKSYEK